jgi:CHASE2 domain-containing sensor protein
VPRAANPKDHIGLASDDTVYTMYFQPLPDHAFTNRVTPYERAFELADADFARTFANKCVIIANFNDPVDRFTGEDGVARPGVMYQVSALTAMLRQTPLTVIHDAWSIALPAFAAGAAAILAFLLLPRPTVPRTICLTLGLTILVASASFIGYQSYLLVLEPFTLWAAALLATLGVVLLTTLRARRSI